MDLSTVSSPLDSVAGPKAPPMILIGLANKDPHNLLALVLPVTIQGVSIKRDMYFVSLDTHFLQHEIWIHVIVIQSPSTLILCLQPVVSVLWFAWFCLGGYYIYTEASAPAKPGHKAQLISPNVQPGGQGQMCLKFWYYMYGRNVASLNVYVQAGLVLPSQPVWKRSGTQGQKWNLASVDISARNTFNVRIRNEFNKSKKALQSGNKSFRVFFTVVIFFVNRWFWKAQGELHI